MKNKFIFTLAVLFMGLFFNFKPVYAAEPISDPQEGLYQPRREDLDLLAWVVRAEAGNQPVEGKRAVVDVVLNRVDSETFPDTIEEVIFQRGQFTCVQNGALDRAARTVDEEDYLAVLMELDNRTDDQILFFSTGKCRNGEFVCKIGDHYFGTLAEE